MERTIAHSYKFALIGFLSIFAVFLNTSCDNGSLNNAQTVQGNVIAEGGEVVKQATVYIPGTPVDGVSPTLPSVMEIDCGEEAGGVITCPYPQEEVCAASCTCDDGYYELDTSNCPSNVDKIGVCTGDNNQVCTENPLNCAGDINCARNLEVNDPKVMSNVTDTYQLVKNSCSADTGTITVTQTALDLTFQGGFSCSENYQGTINYAGEAVFTPCGESVTNCQGTFINGVFRFNCIIGENSCSGEYWN